MLRLRAVRFHVHRKSAANGCGDFSVNYRGVSVGEQVVDRRAVAVLPERSSAHVSSLSYCEVDAMWQRREGARPRAGGV